MLTHTASMSMLAGSGQASDIIGSVDTSPTQPLTIQEIPDAQRGVTILRLVGPVTIHNFSHFQELTEKDLLPPNLIVDLSAVPYIDSAALGAFVAIHVACEASGRKYALAGANERLKNLFDLAYVRTFLVIYDSVAEAEARLFPS